MPPDDSVEDLLDPYRQRLADAMWRVDRDLGEQPPRFVARLTPRLIGSQVHAWAWHHLAAQFEGCEDVVFADARPGGQSVETERELVWFGHVRMRVKRHRPGSLRVSYAPTSRADDFYRGASSAQLRLSIDGEPAPHFINTTLAWIMNPLTWRIRELYVVGWHQRKPEWSFQLPGPSWTAATTSTLSPVSGPPEPFVGPAVDTGEEEPGE